MNRSFRFLPALAMLGFAPLASASFLVYGDMDRLGFGPYSSDPTVGATLQGLAPNAVTYGNLIQGNGYPFSPSPGDYPGTDQIYVGSSQTSTHDGYST